MGVCSWTDGERQVVFGGVGTTVTSPTDGEEYIARNNTEGYNNQVFVLDSFTGDMEWSQPSCTGQRPLPRHSAPYTQVREIGYIFGSECDRSYFNDLFTLNLRTFVGEEAIKRCSHN